MTLPTIQLVSSAETLNDTDPFGFDIEVGNQGSEWNISSSGYAIEVFDIHEDGAAMADGRVFQVSAYLSPPSTLADGPYWSLPYKGSNARINAPVVYDRGIDNYATCFYVDSVAMRAGFFLGRFIQPDTALVLMHHVPVFIEPSDTVGTNIAGLDSSVVSWHLCGCVEGLLPRTYWRSPNIIGTDVYYDERLASNTYDTGLGLVPPVDMFGQPLRGALCVHESYARAVRPPLCDLRTYRTEDSHATYDWRGVWATSVVP